VTREERRANSRIGRLLRQLGAAFRDRPRGR
jgi:hypothetical protein